MIYVTGDIHGGIDIQKLSNKNLKKYNITIGKGDFVIILGDFGLLFWIKIYRKIANIVIG